MVFLEPRVASRKPAHSWPAGRRVPRAYVRAAAWGLPLAAAALWMLSVTTTGAPAGSAERPAEGEAETAPAPWFDLERQRARLEQLTTTPAVAPSRNPFRFATPPVRPTRPPSVGRGPAGEAAHSGAPPALVDPPVPLRLVGIAASPSIDAVSRSAILSGLGQVFIAAAGDLVAEHYRVVVVGDDAVELRDETTGRIVRLGLR